MSHIYNNSVTISGVTLGQQLMAASLPVVIASNQSTLPIQGVITDNRGSGEPVLQVGGFDMVDFNSLRVRGDGSIYVMANQNTTPWVCTINELFGNTINLGIGNTGTGTQRVVIASDQPAIATAVDELPAVSVMADSTANPTLSEIAVYMKAYNGSSWDRIYATGDNSDGIATAARGHLSVLSHNLIFNGTDFDRVRGDITYGMDVDVTRLPSLVAGSAIIGKVGIDQTTPGTTNGVVVNSGTLTTVTTVSTVTAVTAITNALPAGTNAIGKLTSNSGVDIGDVTVNNAVTEPVPVSIRQTAQAYRLFVPKQAVGANLVYFDLFNATGSGKSMRVRSIIPIVSGAVAVTGTLAVDLFLTRTTAVGSGGTAATSEGTSLTACTFTEMDAANTDIPAQVTARLTPTGGATAGAVVTWASVFTEETNAGTYMAPLRNFIDQQGGVNQPLIVSQNTGIRIVQGSVASVGNIGFDVIFELE